MAGFIAVVILIGWIFSQLTDLGVSGVFLAAIISIVTALVGYFGGDRLALATAGAKGPIAKNDNPYL